MKTLKYKWKEINNNTYDFCFYVGNYKNGRIAIEIIDMNDKEPFSMLTINIPDYMLEDDREIIISNDVPKSLLDLLEDKGIIEDTYKLATGGYCRYFVYLLDYDKLCEYVIKKESVNKNEF